MYAPRVRLAISLLGGAAALLSSLLIQRGYRVPFFVGGSSPLASPLMAALHAHLLDPSSSEVAIPLLATLDTIVDDGLLSRDGLLAGWRPEDRVWLLRQALEARSLPGVTLAARWQRQRPPKRT